MLAERPIHGTMADNGLNVFCYCCVVESVCRKVIGGRPPQFLTISYFSGIAETL